MSLALFHIGDASRWDHALANINNLVEALYKKLPDQSHTIIAIANGGAIKGYLENDIAKEIAKILEHSPTSIEIHFYACGNSMHAQKVERAWLCEGVEVVPAAVLALVEYQEQGFAYLKP